MKDFFRKNIAPIIGILLILVDLTIMMFAPIKTTSGNTSPTPAQYTPVPTYGEWLEQGGGTTQKRAEYRTYAHRINSKNYEAKLEYESHNVIEEVPLYQNKEGLFILAVILLGILYFSATFCAENGLTLREWVLSLALVVTVATTFAILGIWIF